MRKILAVLAFLVAAHAHAAPTLTGSLINAVTTSKQRYLPGEMAHVLVVLRNGTGSTFTGTVTGTETGRGQTVNAATVSVSGLSPNATQTIDLAFPTNPGLDFRGYGVAITATSSGATIDTAAAAIDVSSDWAVYPRECFATSFGAGANTSALTDGLNAWHCNIIQAYDVNAAHQMPYSRAATWTNLGGATISRATVESYIGAAHALRMAVFNYTLWNGAWNQFQVDGTGTSLGWGMFTTACSPSCLLANMAGTPSNGGAGALFPAGWAATWIAEMNPNNPFWQAYWQAGNMPTLKNLGYDGWQIDTLGNPGTVYDATGATISLTTALSGFFNVVSSQAAARGVINNVSRWDEVDVATNASEDFYYSEIHPEFGDTATFAALNAATAAIRAHTSKGINFAEYMDDTYSNTGTCQSGGGTTPCFFNLPGLLYADATMFAAGAYHVYLADSDRFISNIYIPGPQLLMSAAAVQAEYDYQTFGVAKEKLLRNGVSDAAQTASITAGATGNTTGAAGGVYLLPKARSGLQILHMLNYSQASTNNSQDINASAAAPTLLNNVAVKMYYGGAVTGSNKLWLASPDINHGSPQSISYTKASDGGGNYITFTAPSLLYWDMCWLELDSLSSSDYATP